MHICRYDPDMSKEAMKRISNHISGQRTNDNNTSKYQLIHMGKTSYQDTLNHIKKHRSIMIYGYHHALHDTLKQSY